MAHRHDTEAIRLLLEHGQLWFGWPPIEGPDGKLIDGRVRFREAVALRIAIPPAARARTASEACRLLCIVGHYERAKEFVPSALHRIDDAAAFCGITERELIAPMFRKPKRPQPRWESRYAHRRAIEQMARLMRSAELTTGYVTADEIRGVLAPWL